MRIRVITQDPGPDGEVELSCELDVADPIAVEMIAKGLAVASGQPAATVRETATRPAPESRGEES